MRIDAVLPTYRPDRRLLDIFEVLSRQTVPVGKIIIMNTEEKYLDNLLLGLKYGEILKKLEIHHISRWEFDHGLTRDQGVAFSDADIVLMMTQDAVPLNENFIEELIRPFEDEKVGSAYARQIPAMDASLAEKFSRSFNYPDTDMLKSKEDLDRLGIKTYFCSNACAAYRKKIFDELGGFIKSTIFNEDMIYACKMINAGYSIAYCSKALVRHSHEYTNKQQFKRNFDLAVSQKMHPEVFEGISSEKEGLKYVKEAFAFFRKHKRPWVIIPFLVTCVYKYAGYFLGKRYDRLSKKRILKCTMNQRFFKKLWNL